MTSGGARPEPLAADDRASIVETLRVRFDANPHRHPDIAWSDVQARLEASPSALGTLFDLERTGGEPDVVGLDGERDGDDREGYVFVDCSSQSPTDRRSVCYDREARLGRKKHPPSSSAQEMAAAMGATLLTAEQYREVQKVGPFDTKTSSWLATPEDIRALGGALFGDCRYETVFVYHNGADSYYAARGFRCRARV